MIRLYTPAADPGNPAECCTHCSHRPQSKGQSSPYPIALRPCIQRIRVMAEGGADHDPSGYRRGWPPPSILDAMPEKPGLCRDEPSAQGGELPLGKSFRSCLRRTIGGPWMTLIALFAIAVTALAIRPMMSIVRTVARASSRSLPESSMLATDPRTVELGRELALRRESVLRYDRHIAEAGDANASQRLWLELKQRDLGDIRLLEQLEALPTRGPADR